MQDKERIEFSYSPPFWPRWVLLALVSLTLLALFLTPLSPLSLTLLLCLVCLIACGLYRYLSISPIVCIDCMQGQWFALLEGDDEKQPLTIVDISRPFQGYLIMRVRIAKHRQQAVFLDERTLGTANFRAVCRRSLIER